MWQVSLVRVFQKMSIRVVCGVNQQCSDYALVNGISYQFNSHSDSMPHTITKSS